VSNNFKHIRNGDFDIIIYEQWTTNKNKKEMLSQHHKKA
jgi:hypothetical protein